MRVAIGIALAVATAVFVVYPQVSDTSQPHSAVADGKRVITLKGPGKRDDWFMNQRGYEDGVDPEAFRRATDQAQQIRQRSLQDDSALTNQPWQFLGPSNIGGRVVDLAVHPNLADTIFVASATGGVWKSSDAGRTFQSVWDDETAQSMGAIAISPEGAIYAATGEANPGGGSIVFGGTGVFKSQDNGATWHNIGLVDSGSIGRLVIDPNDSRRIYVAAMGPLFTSGGQRGLYRTVDGGQTWQLLLAGQNRTTGAVDVVVDPRDGRKIYVAMWDRIRKPDLRRYGGPGSGIFRSIDGGETWQQITSGLPAGEGVGRIGIALAPSRPNQLYAIIAKSTGYFEGLYFSENSGESFAKLPSDSGVAFTQRSFGWWFGRIAVDPNDHRHVFFAGVELSESRDSGGSWRRRTVGHADQHVMKWDPHHPGRFYLGNDGGVFRSDSNGDVRGAWSAGVDQPFTQFYTLAVSRQDPTRIAGGTQDNGSIRSWGAQGWNRHYSGDGLVNLISPRDHNRVYACSQYGNCARSDNGGDRMTSLGATQSSRWNWQVPLVFDPNDPEVMYYGGDIVNRSTDGGRTFTAISPSLSQGRSAGSYPYGTITVIAPAKSHSETIYVGTDDGRLWLTQNLGDSWQEITSEVLPGRWITAIVVHPDDAATFFVSFSGFRSGNNRAHLAMSTDGGQTLQDISGDLPETPVNDVLRVGQNLVVATDVGVFLSKDLGLTWQAVGQNLPLVPVLNLNYHEASKTLRIATFGRGIYLFDGRDAF